MELWVESLHILRVCHTLDRARQLTDRLTGTGVGVVMDFSHVVASGADPVEFIHLFGDRIRHVHLRDATPGNIHHSIGNGAVDFAAGFAALESRRLHRAFHLGAGNPGPHPRGTPRGRREGRRLHQLPALTLRATPQKPPHISGTHLRPAPLPATRPTHQPITQADHIKEKTMTTSTQRTVVITGVGAERGIGRATAHRFARDGWAVAGLDLDGAAPRSWPSNSPNSTECPRSAVRSTSPTRTPCWPSGTPCTPPSCPRSGRC